MVREEKVWCRVLCMEKVGRKERKELKSLGEAAYFEPVIFYITNAHGPSPRSTTFFLMSGRDARVKGTKARKVRTTSTAQSRPASGPSHPPLIRDAATGEHAKTKL
ncbi:hypothetical protein PoB_004699600 [Plakobranchus ocellatus]|uniref:Uncharacterized protein n=1 Tax=Plakobranchus ocellatus TaxID=259542 RepID=A0AAV4BNA2_9GAST|nr:hypothetical protein PoB_004699600 [Plakobranchus ocellatus]